MSTIRLRTKLVKPPVSLLLKQEQKSIIEHILDEVKGLDVAGKRHDCDFLQWIAQIIESQVETPVDGAKPSKMDIFKEALRKLYPDITDDQLLVCQGIIEFALKNKCKIKKVALSKVLKFFLRKKFSLMEQEM
jgi:hypothetical protein